MMRRKPAPFCVTSLNPPVFTQKIEQRPNTGWEEPALAGINGVKYLRLTRIKMIEDRYEPASGNILPHGEGSSANQPDTGKGEMAKALAIADLHASRRGNDDGLSGIPQRPPVD